MRLLFGLSLLAFCVGAGFCQNSTASELGSALESLGLGTLATALELAAKDPVFDAFLTEIGAGNKSFFVPTSISDDQLETFGLHPSSLLQILDYHIARGMISPSVAPTAPAHLVASTLLTDNSTVSLEGGNAQWLVATKQNDGNLHILNQPTDVVVSKSQNVDTLNMVINLVDSVLIPPTNISATLAAKNLSQFQASLQKAGLLDTLSNEHGVTIFAPTDAAFTSAGSAISGADNPTLTTILQNHVINRTVYSTSLGSTQYSVTGQTLHLSNSSVSAGGSSASLSQTDIGLQNGVLHIIDTVLLDKTTGPSSWAHRKAARVGLPSIILTLVVISFATL